MMDDVLLTLFCSLQRLKVCLIASIAKMLSKRIMGEEGCFRSEDPLSFKKILKPKLLVTAFSATDRGRMNSATCQVPLMHVRPQLQVPLGIVAPTLRSAGCS